MKASTDLYYAVVVKAANAARRSVLIDDVRVRPFELGGSTFRQVTAQVVDVTGMSTIYLPTARNKDQRIDVVPLILPPDQTRVYALEFVFEGPENANRSVSPQPQMLIDFRINGIFRGYRVDPSGGRSLAGYRFDLDPGEGLDR